ncbi:MAG: transferrin-binding protein-like solute binding protein [Paracoccaceae bacterium]
MQTYILTSGALLVLLSACGATVPDATPDPDPVPDPVTPPSYETLDSTADATSILGGTIIERERITAGPLVSTAGELVHNTGRTTINVNEGAHIIVDPDGVDENGQITDGTATINVDSMSSNYDYARVYFIQYGPNEFFATAVGGIVTHEDHMPTAGTGTYTGEAEARIRYISGNDPRRVFLENGTSRVDVDFASGSVDVTMNNFTSDEPSPIDTILIYDMTLSGNAFAGGTIITTNQGEEINVTGDNSVAFAGGNFFGYDDAISGPDEVAGVFDDRGDNYLKVKGHFMAD